MRPSILIDLESTATTGHRSISCFHRFANTITHPGLALGLMQILGFMTLQANRTSAFEPTVVEHAIPERIEFNRDIRPILSDHCFACHGPDAKHRQADLRVDTQAGLVGSEGQSGTVVPGHPDQSELWKRVTDADSEQQMPPPSFGKPLTDRQRQLLRRWIEQGAVWQGHWAFEPISRPKPPIPPASAPRPFLRNEIDSFVIKLMHEQGLSPSPEADPRTLVRRLSFDLIGLPPTMEQVQSFTQDSSLAAYERLVDDLLASPHFGERMAMWWLDLVRYADSVGYHGDQPVSVSPFRDYVIRSFNSNKPFDVMTREHLAGDLLPAPTTEQLIASGYNRLGMMSAEGGVQPKEYLAKYIAERVRNLSGTWLGVTFGCCECHDHKYDPFTMQDFYQLEAFFADIEEQGLYSGASFGTNMPVPTSEQADRQRDLESRIQAVKQQIETPTPQLVEAQQSWERSLPKWQTMVPVSMTSQGSATMAIQPDGAVLVSGNSPDMDTYTLEFSTIPAQVRALRLEVLPHESLPNKGPGRAGNGNFVLSEMWIDQSATGTGNWMRQRIAHATASYEQTGAAGDNPYGKWAIAAAIDDDAKGAKWGWAIMEQAGKPNQAIFVLADTIGGENQTVKVTLHQKLDNPKHTLGHFRLSMTTASAEQQSLASLAAAPMPIDVEQALAIPVDQRTAEQQSKIAAHYRSISPLLADARNQLKELSNQLDALNKSITTTLVTKMVPPRTIRVLNRGNWMDESGNVVEPGIPSALGKSGRVDRRLTRLDLADWVVSPDNPLTARVTVNRLWKLFFGAGLSPRVDDLGSQGQWPQHLELLDWLSGQFIESGWNVKQLVKYMVMSGTYRQSSTASDALLEKDPFNQWLSRQGRFRLDAEMVRDNALMVSGLLVDHLGGQSVNPYQPPGYWAYLNFPQREWVNSKQDQLYRRGLYTHWQRQYLHPSLLAFDAPSREECTADRPRSNTPLQALVLLNDPTYIEAARCLAERVIREVNTSDENQQLIRLFELALNRPPRDQEINVLQSMLRSHRQQYAADPDAAKKLIAIGDKPADAALDPGNLAAWTSVARAVLNLHEFITRN